MSGGLALILMQVVAPAGMMHLLLLGVQQEKGWTHACPIPCSCLPFCRPPSSR